MAFILALTPIVVILVLMVGLRWGAARAGGAGYLSALLIALLFFGADPILLAYAHARAFFLAIDVLMIIWAAFLLYRIADEAGAIRVISGALPHLTGDSGMQALIIGWVFASFLQGVGGFGVPVAVIAPILVGLGFSPLAAVVIPSIGHGWSVTFGSLGSSFQALMAATGLPGEQLATTTAIFLGVVCLVSGWMVAHAADGWTAVRRLWSPALIIGVVMGVMQTLMVSAGFWNIGAFGGAVAGMVVAIPLARRFKGEQSDNGELYLRSVFIALSGYVVTVVVILAVQLVPIIRVYLSVLVLQVDFPQTTTSMNSLNPGFVTPAGPGRTIVLFRHTGVLLAFSSLVAYFIYKFAGLYEAGAARRIIDGTLRRVMSSSVSILSMVSMAVIMENTGMTETLARGLAGGMGAIYPMVAPWMGALGAFMTGSNTNSNVVFGALQLQTAVILGYSVTVILAGQTAGAAVASVLAPTKVVVGASTAGMAGREGYVLRKLFVYVALLLLLVSLMTAVGVLLL
jgi:lactate permease